MISKHRLSHDAELITPVSYINPNIQVDRAKIKFFPVNHNNAQQFIFLTIINAVRPLIRNFDSFEVIKFKTNNFSSIDPHTQNWGPIKHYSGPQKKENILFEQYFNKNTSQLNIQISATHYKNKFGKLRADYISNTANQHKKNLFLEKRIEHIFDSYCPMWASQKQQIASQYWLSPSNNYEYHQELDTLIKTLLKEAYYL